MSEFKPKSKVYDDGLETNLVGIAEHIFKKDPSPPYTIGLQLDHPIDSGKSADEVVQEMMTILLLKGVEIKFGSDVAFSSLTKEQKDLLRRYMWSVGYDPIIHMEEEGFWIEFVPYKQ